MNQAKTLLLIVAMTGLLVWIGDLLGGQSGMVLALAVGLILNGVSYFFSDKIVLASYGAQPVSQAEAPQLHAIVANLAQRAGLPMPRIAIIPEDTPNAFATGRNPEHAVVAVTEGIMRVLSRPELESLATSWATSSIGTSSSAAWQLSWPRPSCSCPAWPSGSAPGMRRAAPIPWRVLPS